MKSKELACEIAALEQKRNALATRLDTFIGKFQDLLPSIVESWIRREVERNIEDRPGQVEKLGVEKLKIMKSKINTMVASLPKIVQEETSDKRGWPHYQATITKGYGPDKNELFFNDAFRNVINHVGVILNEFGLLSEIEGRVLSWIKLADGKFRFAINLGFDVLSVQPVEEFNELYKQYKALKVELGDKQKELAKAKAKELWESA